MLKSSYQRWRGSTSQPQRTTRQVSQRAGAEVLGGEQRNEGRIYQNIWEELSVNKFRNKKIFTKDGKFDSKREMHRYLELAAMQQAGKITGLERQVRYILLGSQKREDGTTERPVSYTADFRYTDKKGKIVVEDVKSPRTRKNPEYIIKRKLMLERYGITIREVA